MVEEEGMDNRPLEVEISSNGQPIGRLSCDVFREGADAPRSMSLPEVVERWNAWKAEINEPERAKLVGAN